MQSVYLYRPCGRIRQSEAQKAARRPDVLGGGAAGDPFRIRKELANVENSILAQ